MHTMEYGKAFAYLQQENGWIKKFLIAAFIPLVPLIGSFLLLGYSLEVTRRVIHNENPVLPEWNDFGDYLKKGFVAIVVGLVYSLPLILIASCLITPAVVLAQNADNTLQVAGQVLGICGGCLSALFGALTVLLIPAALGRLAAQGQMGAAFRMGEVFELVRTKPGIYIVMSIMIFIATLVLLPIGLLACGIGLFPAGAFVNLAAAHLYGQAYRVAAGESGLV